MFSAGQDTNGNGMRLHEGFERLSQDWQVDLIALRQSWIRYPEQFPKGGPGERRRLALKLAEKAELLHLFNGLQSWRDLDQRRGRPIVVHHHGTSFRNDHHRIAAGAKAIGAVQVASTIDLAILEPNVMWLPAIYNLAELAAIRERVYQPGDRIRIVHAPTKRGIKNTPAVLAAIEELGAKVPIEFDLIEKRPWTECLERVARADILVDQLTLGHGSLAVEAWGMSIPVVAGVIEGASTPAEPRATPGTRAEMLRRWRKLPFVEATPDNLAAKLLALVRSEDARATAAGRGHEHAQRFHDESAVVPQLEAIYDAAPRTALPPSTWRGIKPWRKATAA